MNRKMVISLRCMFQELRYYANLEDRYWMRRQNDEIRGYIKALWHAGLIDEITYNKIFEISLNMSVYGLKIKVA